MLTNFIMKYLYYIQMKMLMLICMVFLMSLGSSKLSVYDYGNLGRHDPGLQNIDYSIANFGNIPIGKTMVKRVVMSPHHSDECIIPQLSKEEENIISGSIVLIPRGGCNFVYKIINAQKMGAHMAIVMDNQTHFGKIIMKDNGYGYKVQIPSIFINYQDGQRLQNLVQLKNHQGQQNIVQLKVEFEALKSQKATLILWLQANNRQSYKLVADFEEYYNKIIPFLDLILVYDVDKCYDCDIENDCYENGRFCSVHIMNHLQGANGKKILNQQLREKLIFLNNKQKWWTFMREFDRQCTKISEFEQCSKMCMKKCGINVQIIEKQLKQETQGNRVLLDNDYELLQYSGIKNFPSASLNYQTIKGSLKAQYIFEDICRSLLNPPPDACRGIIVDPPPPVSWLTVVILLLIGIICFFIIVIMVQLKFCCYRRYLNRQMGSQIQQRVNDMVGRYVEFYEQRSNQNET